MNFLQKLLESKQAKQDREELTRLREEARQADELKLAAEIRAKIEQEQRDLTPWADIVYHDGKMKINDYNARFVEDLKQKMGDLTTDLTDDQIVNLFTDRENVEIEEPRLDIKHSGITEDGRIKMELDWNTSFIRHLADNGIQAESEEQAVQLYLSLLTHQAAEDIVPEMLSREDVDAAFHDLTEEAEAELAEAARQVQENSDLIKKNKKPRRRKVTGSPRE